MFYLGAIYKFCRIIEVEHILRNTYMIEILNRKIKILIPFISFKFYPLIYTSPLEQPLKALETSGGG